MTLLRLKFTPRFWAYVVPIALLALVWVLQINYDFLEIGKRVRQSVAANKFIEPYVVNANSAPKFALGLQNALADWTWIQAIQYFGGGDPYGKYEELAPMLDTVTALDPKFEYPYVFGNLILPSQGDLDKAEQISQRGLQAIPGSWQIPYYLAAGFHIYKKDYAMAAKYMNIAADKPGVPAAAKLTASVYYKKAGDRETAYMMWGVIAETSDNEFVRETAKKYIGQYELILFLEEAAKVYKNKYGSYPNSLQDLVTQKILKELPPNPLERELIINSQTGEVSEKSIR